MAIRNYLKVFADGHTEATKFRPLFQQGERERAYAGENPDVLVNGKWWSSVADGGELVTNGTFDTDVSGWLSGNGATLTVVNGRLRVAQTTQDNVYAYQEILCVEGKEYALKGFMYDIANNDARISIGTTIGAIDVQHNSGVSSDGKYVDTTFISPKTGPLYVFLGNATTTDNTYTEFDNISVYKKEITPDVPYEEQFTYMAKDDKLASFLIEDGQPVDITYDYDSPSIVQDVIQAGKVIWTDYESQMKFLQSDGVDYDDPDAIGANPVAKIYPDGTIVGSTDNGEYTKYPNGDVIGTIKRQYVGAINQSTINGGYFVPIYSIPFPISLNTVPVVQSEVDFSTTTSEIQGITSTDFDMRLSIIASTASVTVDYQIIFIGRWK